MGKRVRAALVAGLGLALPLGCKSKPPCASRVEALSAWMRTLEGEGDVVPKGSVPMVDEPSRASASSGLDVALDGPRLTLDGGRVLTTADVPSMVEQLRQYREGRTAVARRLHPGGRAPELPARFLVRPATAWRDVAIAFDGLGRAGFTRVAIVLIGKSTAEPPSASRVSRWFEEHASSSDDPWAATAAPMHALLQCPTMLTVVKTATSDSLDRTAVNGLLREDGLREMQRCGCGMADEDLKAMIWRANRRYTDAPSVTHTLVPGAPGAPGVVELSAAATETWGSMTSRVVETAAKNAPIVFVSH